MAHIFAASNAGPRSDRSLSEEQRGSFENLILLCPSCHTEIDKAPDAYPDAMIAEWKAEHAAKVAKLFGAVRFETREEVRQAIDPVLAENRAIFDGYGPENAYRSDPESEYADAWRSKVQRRSIPNNRKILAILDENRRHLLPAELRTLEEFRQHVDDFESRHLGEGVQVVGRRFPAAMNLIASSFQRQQDMTDRVSWTGRWVAKKMLDRTEVASVEELHAQLLCIHRKTEASFVVATLAATRVEPAMIHALSGLGHRIDFFVNIPKEAYWTEGAFQAVDRLNAAFGGMGDLHRAITMPDPPKYVNPEFAFVERGLRQHSRVCGWRRLFDRKYLIERDGLDDVVVVLLNEYELTADHVRTARDRYGNFDAVLMTNPNSCATTEATRAANSMGISIFKWAEFLSRLNYK